MLVVSDEFSNRVGGEGRLSSSGETEEERNVSVGSFVGGRVEGELSKFDGLQVMLRSTKSQFLRGELRTKSTDHDREDTLLHLSSVLGTEDDHLFSLEVDLDGSGRRHTLKIGIVSARVLHFANE